MDVMVSAITPRYRDLFKGMLDSDRNRADAAYDAILFDRKLAAPALIEQYKKANKNETMRYLCVQLMGFSDSKKVISPLIDALDDPSAVVRREACFALEDLSAYEAIDTIKQRIQDVDPDVRQIAREVYDLLNGFNHT